MALAIVIGDGLSAVAVQRHAAPLLSALRSAFGDAVTVAPLIIATQARVAPADEIAAREKADLEARKEIRELEPLLSEYVQVNYAKASDLAELMMG